MAGHFVVINRTAIFRLVLAMMAMTIAPSAGESRFSDLREIEIHNHLKRLNKPAIKSIKSPDGDVIDCVSITDQPAFDHPLLRNHTIQMRPSFYPENVFTGEKISLNTNNQSEVINQFWHMNGKCPESTIPIRRTRKEDLLRVNYVESYGKKPHGSIPQPKSYNLTSIADNSHQHAIAFMNEGKFYGAKARINLWKPRVQMRNEFSLSQIWVLGGDPSFDRNSIEAGWQVSQNLYGDDKTRLFVYWTKDSYRFTGCYNHLCPGFVQINKEIALGTSIVPISTYGGPQFSIAILIWKDIKTHNWWLQLNDKYILGYWPSSLLPNLSDGATIVEWGGEVVNSQTGGQHTTTQMGSGHFAEEGFKKASYFKNIMIVDGSNALRHPQKLQVFAPYSTCYNLRTKVGIRWGNYFFYGGPGRNPKCP